MRRKVIDPYIKYSSLSVNAQRVFAHIELILMRYNTKELKITKEDLSYECVMSIAGVKVSLRELKEKGYIVSKNSNSSIVHVGELYEYKGK
jgi:predicted transcriptional regulator